MLNTLVAGAWLAASWLKANSILIIPFCEA